MASKEESKTKKKVFYGVEEVLAELECESDTENLVESDSYESYDSAEEDAFLDGEDPVLDESDSDEQWEPPVKTKKSRRSLTLLLRSPTPTGSSPIPPILSATQGASCTLPTAFSPELPGPSSPTATQTSTHAAVAKKKRRTPTQQVGVSTQVLGQEQEDMWHDITDDDTNPPLPKFLPKRPPGPQLVSSTTYSPLQLFQLFFSTSVVQTIVDNTNKFAEMSATTGKKLKWTSVSVTEFYAFVSLIIYMGLVKAKNLVDYWSKKQIYRLPYPCSVMSSKRFFAISSNLHLSDPDEDAENMKKRGTSGYDKLFKIKPLYRDILSACCTFFQPRRELSIDERMVASKARIGLKQYMKAKPTKWGYKLFVLADSASGYTWNFFVYEGKNSMASGKGLGYESVKTLLDYSLLGTGYKVYMDNFYTSPTLFSDLLKEHTLACGTMRTKRQGFPRLKRGTIRWYREGKLLFVKWMDTREVNMCSTMHKAYTGDTVNRRIKNDQGEWSTTTVPIPAAVKDYNKHMGGVDLSDALIGYYNVLHKSKKWYKTFFFHFIDIAIVNSFVLHKEMAMVHGQDFLTQKNFRERLLVELANIWTKSSDVTAEPTAGPSVQPSQDVNCMPAFFSADATRGRKKCQLCKDAGLQIKTPVYCTKCDVALCFVPKRNCFKQWHENH